MEYFFNKGLLHMEGQELCFYNIGANVDKVKREPELVEDVVTWTWQSNGRRWQ